MAEVLVVGNGGREDTLRQTMEASPEVSRVVMSPDAMAGLEQFSGSKEKPFVVVGPEQPLVDGLADHLREEGYTVFGAGEEAARYEASKSFAVEMMRRAGVSHPNTFIAKTLEEARDYVATHDPLKYVIKADGLAAGKGVVLPKTLAEAQEVTIGAKNGTLFGGAGRDILNYQERHEGPEVSAMAVVGDNNEFVLLPIAQDHKRLGEGDTGPNTGGMGAYAPVPDTILSPLQYNGLYETVANSLEGMRHVGTPFERGLLYVGAMLSKQRRGESVVIEYNVRFGDPETQVVLPLLKHAGVDVYRLLRSAAEGNLEKPDVDFSGLALSALTVCLAAKGYPDTPQKGDRIWGLDHTRTDVVVQRAGIKDNKTTGGRVLYLTGIGRDIDEAARLVYGTIDLDREGPSSGKVGFSGMQLRRDIAHQARQQK